ncbi:hypothetical protein C8R44DRAFT_723833 [Mycena epipterygia]|nr:hypothetical protein C8R44DRAFT_723833 [Mycena epipterygia]
MPPPKPTLDLLADFNDPPCTFVSCDPPDYLGSNFTDHETFSKNGHQHYWLVFLGRFQGWYSTKQAALANLDGYAEENSLQSFPERPTHRLASCKAHQPDHDRCNHSTNGTPNAQAAPAITHRRVAPPVTLPRPGPAPTAARGPALTTARGPALTAPALPRVSAAATDPGIAHYAYNWRVGTVRSGAAVPHRAPTTQPEPQVKLELNVKHEPSASPAHVHRPPPSRPSCNVRGRHDSTSPKRVVPLFDSDSDNEALGVHPNMETERPPPNYSDLSPPLSTTPSSISTSSTLTSVPPATLDCSSRAFTSCPQNTPSNPAATAQAASASASAPLPRSEPTSYGMIYELAHRETSTWTPPTDRLYFAIEFARVYDEGLSLEAQRTAQRFISQRTGGIFLQLQAALRDAEGCGVHVFASWSDASITFYSIYETSSKPNALDFFGPIAHLATPEQFARRRALRLREMNKKMRDEALLRNAGIHVPRISLYERIRCMEIEVLEELEREVEDAIWVEIKDNPRKQAMPMHAEDVLRVRHMVQGLEEQLRAIHRMEVEVRLWAERVLAADLLLLKCAINHGTAHCQCSHLASSHSDPTTAPVLKTSGEGSTPTSPSSTPGGDSAPTSPPLPPPADDDGTPADDDEDPAWQDQDDDDGIPAHKPGVSTWCQRNPDRPVIPLRTGRKKQSTETRATAKMKRAVAKKERQDLQADIDGINEARNKMAEEVAAKHHVKVDLVLRRLMAKSSFKAMRKVNMFNAKVHHLSKWLRKRGESVNFEDVKGRVLTDPEFQAQCERSIHDIESIRKVRDTLKSGKCFWHKMSANEKAEVEAEYEELLEEGLVTEVKRKERSDKNKCRKDPETEGAATRSKDKNARQRRVWEEDDSDEEEAPPKKKRKDSGEKRKRSSKGGEEETSGRKKRKGRDDDEEENRPPKKKTSMSSTSSSLTRKLSSTSSSSTQKSSSTSSSTRKSSTSSKTSKTSKAHGSQAAGKSKFEEMRKHLKSLASAKSSSSKISTKMPPAMRKGPPGIHRGDPGYVSAGGESESEDDN